MAGSAQAAQFLSVRMILRAGPEKDVVWGRKKGTGT
jgi:hypothetical protein